MRKPRPRGNSGNTSVDSMMQDTPANYNHQNQRFDETNGTGNGGNQNQDLASGQEMDGDMEYDMEDDDEYGD